MPDTEETPIKRLMWYPDLKFHVTIWEDDLKKAEAQVAHLKKSIKTTKQWLKETEKERPQLFAAILKDESQILDAYTNGSRFSFRKNETQQVYEKHNRALIPKLLHNNLHILKFYLWETETLQSADDWNFIVQTIIDMGELVRIKEFAKFQFKYMTKKARETIVEYIDSVALADVMVAAE